MAKTKDGFGCARCDNFTAEGIITFGDVSTRLCNDCRNALRDLVEAMPEWTELHDNDVRAKTIQIAASGVRDCYDEIKPLHDRAKAIRIIVRGAINQWLATEATVVGPRA